MEGVTAEVDAAVVASRLFRLCAHARALTARLPRAALVVAMTAVLR